MKKAPVIMGICCILHTCCFGQTKRLLKSFPCTPINYALLPYQGLKGSPATISIKDSAVAVARLNTNGTARVDHVNDTLPLITIDMPAKYVFDIIRTIGSYTVIKFWEVNPGKGDNISNYEYYSEYANNVTSIKVRNLNYSSVKMDKKKLSIKNTKDYYLVKIRFTQ